MITKHEEKLRSVFKNMFSLKEDTATHEEIRDRLLSGGKITGTNMCVLSGYSIANGRWDMLLGAAYLFAIKAYFIMMSSAVILSLLKIPKVKSATEQEWKKSACVWCATPYFF